MKLSFSTNGWEAYSWDEWLDAAEDMKLHGVEVYAPQDSETLLGRGGPFHAYARAATVRALRDRGLAVPNLDSGADLLSGSDEIPRLLGSKCTRKQLLQLVSVAEDTYQRALQNANNALLITKFCADLRQAIGR